MQEAFQFLQALLEGMDVGFRWVALLDQTYSYRYMLRIWSYPPSLVGCMYTQDYRQDRRSTCCWACLDHRLVNETHK
jgi:hypothetical protein